MIRLGKLLNHTKNRYGKGGSHTSYGFRLFRIIFSCQYNHISKKNQRCRMLLNLPYRLSAQMGYCALMEVMKMLIIQVNNVKSTSILQRFTLLGNILLYIDKCCLSR